MYRQCPALIKKRSLHPCWKVFGEADNPGDLIAHSQDTAFERFVTQRKKDLQRIASHTRGEHQLQDVVNEAWLLALELAERQASPVEFAGPAFQKLLLSHLYQHLVRYTELNVRHAVRLDHAPAGGDSQDDPHPLMHVLVSDGGRDPLAELIETGVSA